MVQAGRSARRSARATVAGELGEQRAHGGACRHRAARGRARANRVARRGNRNRTRDAQALVDRDELSCATRASGGLPRLETGHRVVRGEPCHFSAPATLVEETAQPTGRLLLTSARIIFVGGGTSVAVPWHGVSAAAHGDRDLVLVKSGGEVAYRFRCNSYTDALCAAYIGREILAARRTAPPGL